MLKLSLTEEARAAIREEYEAGEIQLRFSAHEEPGGGGFTCELFSVQAAEVDLEEDVEMAFEDILVYVNKQFLFILPEVIIDCIHTDKGKIFTFQKPVTK